MPVEITAVHPVLMAHDVTASLAFYARCGFTLAFQDDPVAPRYAVMRRAAVELHLQWADASQWAHAGDRPVYRFPTPEVDALYAELVRSGAIASGTSAGPYAMPAPTPWGTREFHVRDPGGNVLQFHGSPVVRHAGADTPVELAIPILPADDLHAARMFYVGGLGFSVRFEVSENGTTGLLGLARGPIWLTIDAPMTGHGRQACVSLQVESADRYYGEWRERVPIAQPPRDEPWGARTFSVHDPAGNTIFVMGPPSGEAAGEPAAWRIAAAGEGCRDWRLAEEREHGAHEMVSPFRPRARCRTRHGVRG